MNGGGRCAPGGERMDGKKRDETARLTIGVRLRFRKTVRSVFQRLG